MVAEQAERGPIGIAWLPDDVQDAPQSRQEPILGDNASSVPQRGTVNADPTVQQILKGFLIDVLSPEFLFAFFGSLSDWIGGLRAGAPILWLTVVQAVIVAALAGVRAVKAHSGGTGQALVFRAAGLINGGR